MSQVTGREAVWSWGWGLAPKMPVTNGDEGHQAIVHGQAASPFASPCSFPPRLPRTLSVASAKPNNRT